MRVNARDQEYAERVVAYLERVGRPVTRSEIEARVRPGGADVGETRAALERLAAAGWLGLQARISRRGRSRVMVMAGPAAERAGLVGEPDWLRPTDEGAARFYQRRSRVDDEYYADRASYWRIAGKRPVSASLSVEGNTA